MNIDGIHVLRGASSTADAADPLLFLVGLGGRAEFWEPQFARFGHRDCISFDHRKTQDSIPADVTTAVRALADDAIRVLDGLAIERIDVIGHSLGAAIAQQLAVYHPSRVGRLVLSAGWCGPTPWFTELFTLRKQVLAQCGPRAYMLQGNLLGNPGWWTFANHAQMIASVDARVAGFAGVEIECARMDAVTSHDLRQQVASIGAQTLVICARDDGITPLPLSQELAQRIPGAKLEVLETGSHFAPVCTADAWAKPVMEFLA